MAIKRFTASVDTTITNAFMRDLNTRATGANMGASDILEVFSIYGQASTGSVELSRILIKFPTAQMSDDRTAGDIPASGSVSFYLRMFNARHSQTTPRNFSLMEMPVAIGCQRLLLQSGQFLVAIFILRLGEIQSLLQKAMKISTLILQNLLKNG